MYRPLVSVTLVLDWLVSGKNPVSFHVTNLVLHFLCAFLLYMCVVKLSGQRRWSLWIAFLFLFYPGQFETSYWIIGRVSSLPVFFILCSTYLATSDVLSMGRRWGIGLGLFLALLSKETGIIGLPVLLSVRFFVNGMKLEKESVRLLARDLAPSIAFVAIYLCVYQFAIGIGTLPYHGQQASDWIPRFEKVYLLPGVLFPMNRLHLGLSSDASRAIQILFLVLFVVVVALQRTHQTKAQRLRVAAVFVALVIASTAPMMALLDVSADLQSTRHFYHIVAFAFVGLGMIRPKENVSFLSVPESLMGIILVLYVIAFSFNLQPWARVSQGVQQVREGLRESFSRYKDRPELLNDWVVYGEIDNYFGAMFLRNSMGGFIHTTDPSFLKFGILPLSLSDAPSAQSAMVRFLSASDPSRKDRVLGFSFKSGFSVLNRLEERIANSSIPILLNRVEWIQPVKYTYRDLENAAAVILDVENHEDAKGALCLEWAYIEFDEHVRTRGGYCSDQAKLIVPVDLYPEWLEVSRIRNLHVYTKANKTPRIRISLDSGQSRPLLSHIPPDDLSRSFLSNLRVAPIGGVVFRQISATDPSNLEIDVQLQSETHLVIEASREISFKESIAILNPSSGRKFPENIRRLSISSPFAALQGSHWYVRACGEGRCSIPISFFYF